MSSRHQQIPAVGKEGCCCWHRPAQADLSKVWSSGRCPSPRQWVLEWPLMFSPTQTIPWLYDSLIQSLNLWQVRHARRWQWHASSHLLPSHNVKAAQSLFYLIYRTKAAKAHKPKIHSVRVFAYTAKSKNMGESWAVLIHSLKDIKSNLALADNNGKVLNSFAGRKPGSKWCSSSYRRSQWLE